ncbi:hypothetical protein BDY17DRAFT_291664 [Neohortaea acidophila]|uniref:Mitochondrial inner-membrane-bound regulator-domain-containing protein n=1 Tax=Neohortaea acidophila TaxID=245834 RepID=A0A6A6Q4F4_9PEZI|nr:uncharacterized protein BDY17DRAFT_291664 [Neohortaea acidophila]KAF2486533.1 hypothetical protein BDY17DRAFT_291664 [Neohortaea acidophila]
MLDVPWRAMPSSCLKQHLRHIILRTRVNYSPQCRRGFQTSTRYRQDDAGADKVFLRSNAVDDRRRARYRLAYPLGRVVGQPGRRQRQTTETLKIASMQQPFDVVVMRDMPEAKKSKSAEITPTSPPALNLSSGISTSGEEPTQEEINESIEALRPQFSILDQHEFDRLVAELVKGYNRKQLAAYLAAATRPVDSTAGERESTSRRRATVWRPVMSSPPEESTEIAKGKMGKGKMKHLANQILRAAWNVRIDAEEQRLGLISLPLEDWQSRYLFSRASPNGQFVYEQLIQSPLLLRASRITQNIHQGLMHVTARRQDAEEIITLIEAGLRDVGRLDLSLAPFKSILETQKPDSAQGIAQLFPPSVLAEIERHSSSILQPDFDGRVLRIHARSEMEREYAQRLFLSRLPLHAPSAITSLSLGKNEAKWTQHDGLAVEPTANLPFRHHGTQFFRPTAVARTMKDVSDAPIRAHAKKLCDDIATAVRASDTRALPGDKIPDSSYWERPHAATAPNQELQLCKILNPLPTQAQRGKKKVGKPERQPLQATAIQYEVPGLNTLLSYFQPAKAQQYAFDDAFLKSPTLVAHFIPSPFTSAGVTVLQHTPRIQLHFDYADGADGQSLHLSRMQATFQHAFNRIPLLNDTSDLQLVKWHSLTAQREQAEQDTEIARFTRTLRHSVSAGSGALVGDPTVKFKIPSHFLRQDSAGQEDVEVEYVFERFEQRQSADLVPARDDEILQTAKDELRQMVDGWPASARLRYSEWQSGVVGGSGKGVSLIIDEAAHGEMHAGERRKRDVALMATALGLTRCLTLATAREISPLSAMNRR